MPIMYAKSCYLIFSVKPESDSACPEVLSDGCWLQWRHHPTFTAGSWSKIGKKVHDFTKEANELVEKWPYRLSSPSSGDKSSLSYEKCSDLIFHDWARCKSLGRRCCSPCYYWTLSFKSILTKNVRLQETVNALQVMHVFRAPSYSWRTKQTGTACKLSGSQSSWQT